MRDVENTWIEERVRHLDGPASYEERLKRARDLAHACRLRVELHDPYTKEHSARVARWVRIIGARLPTFDRERLDRLEITALVHDFGKIDVAPEILNKPGRLGAREIQEVQKHPVRGALRLEPFKDFVAMDGVLYHHVRYAGGGYPDGAFLRGAQIPIEARIIAVADTFDALTSDRAYRKGCAPIEALQIMRREAREQLDPTLVRIFSDYYRQETTRKGYSPGATTIELSATIDEEIRRALEFLRDQLGIVDWADPLSRVPDKEAFCQKAVDHLVSLSYDRACAEKFVRAAYRLPQRESFDPDDILEVDETSRPVEGAAPGHREVTVRLKEVRPEHRDQQIAVFRGKLWKCVIDGTRMVLLR